MYNWNIGAYMGQETINDQFWLLSAAAVAGAAMGVICCYLDPTTTQTIIQ